MIEPTINKHQWEMRTCPWCQKPHVKYPKACVMAATRLVKRYKPTKPEWVNQLVRDVNDYLESFRQFIK